MTRRSVLIAAGACLVLPRLAEASTLAISRELRRMVGFQIIATDDVRQSWQQRLDRFIELRQSGLFRQVGVAIGVDPPAFTDAIVFAKPADRANRLRYPGLSERAYYDYRLLIDGEFYHVVAHD